MIATTYAVSCETARFAGRNEPPAFDEVRFRLSLNETRNPSMGAWTARNNATKVARKRTQATEIIGRRKLVRGASAVSLPVDGASDSRCFPEARSVRTAGSNPHSLAAEGF
jgi:hypothetical protein